MRTAAVTAAVVQCHIVSAVGVCAVFLSGASSSMSLQVHQLAIGAVSLCTIIAV
jgi:hypothetical protein